MDELERQEINGLLKKYQMEKTAKTILDNLFAGKARINKASLKRKGYNDDQIHSMVNGLRQVLGEYNENQQ